MKINPNIVRGMGLQAKLCVIFMVLIAAFLYQGILKPLIGDTATKTYYFTLDSSSVNLGADGNTNTSATRNGKISMKTGVYTTSRYVTASTTTAEQNMIRAYAPAYSSKQTLTAPAVTIGLRDRNGTANNIYWKAYVYDYNPAGTAGNGVLLWTSDEKEAHPSVQTPVELTFTDPQPKDVDAGHRIKVVITCRMASTASSARFYWGSSTNYSFFTVTEAPYVANSITVNNLSDYYNGQLASVTQGDSNIPMLKLDMHSNVAGGAAWSGGKLDKIGTNNSVYLNEDEPGDVSFAIFKDGNGDGLFQKTDTLIGGPYNFTVLTGQGYELAIPQTITSTPQRYFIVYNFLRNSTYNTTAGARIADSSYFTTTGAAGGVINVASTSSSTPTIQYGGTAVTKIYAADWDGGTSLAGIAETAGPAITDSNCITRNTAGSGFPLVGLLNYPGHTCASVAGQGYSTNSAQTDFVRLYFAGAGYHSIMKTVKGGSFTYRVYTPSGGGTVTLQLFYVTSDGVRVNAPIVSRYTTTSSVSRTNTTSLAGQDFSNVPAGARLGIQIGVTANMRIGLGGANSAQLTLQETAAENENVDVGNGTTIANATVYASDVNKVIDSFTLTAAKPKTVTAVTITGNTPFTDTNVKEVRLYADAGTTIGILDGSDTLLGSTTVISGNEAIISGLNLAVSTSVKRYLVVVDIGDAPNTNVILTALVGDVTVATTGGIGVNSDSTSATLTILPTTTLSDFITAEPPGQVIPWNASATKVDAFGLKTNGGMNDTIHNVTVTLTTTSALPAGKVISDYVGRVDIVTGAGASLGHLTAPTMADNWQVPTTGLAATQTDTDYFVAITPKGNQGITFTVKGTVTAISHSRLTNKLVANDNGSATIIMDEEPPNPEPALTAATGTYHNDTDRAEIDLSWVATTDASGAPVTYKLVRGLGNAPAPRNCTVDNVKSFLVYQGPGTSFVNKELDEGVLYGYRVCAIDSVNNISAGSNSSTIASIKNRCSEIPELVVNPTASYVKAGETVKMSIGIKNKDTGVCAPTTFSLEIIGTNDDDSNYTASSFEGNNFVIPTGTSQYTHLNTTAKQGAAQGAVKSFHVKVAKSSGGETQCPEPVTVVVNKYGTMTHSSMQLGTKKYGTWGVDYTCTTCHSPNSTNIKQIKDIIVTPTGDRTVIFNTISTAAGADTDGVFGNDQRNGTASTNVCEVCHHRARFHQYSAAKVSWKEHNNNGDCLKCHPHSIGFKTKATGQSCDDCHGNPPTTDEMLVVPPTEVLFPYANNAGSHEKHEARQLECTACHNNANHLASAAPDMKLNMGFSIKNGNFLGFFGNISTGTMRTLPPGNDYSWVGAAGTTIQQAPNTIMTCNVYCHGWEDNGGYNTEPAWTGITQVGCGSCHAATADLPPPSGSHAKHAGNEPGYGNGITCTTCHGFRNYTTSSAHINGNVEWDLSAITPIATYGDQNYGATGAAAPTLPGNYEHCGNLYCHSNVQSNNGTGAPTSYSSPAWGGTTTCNSCHQAEPNATGGHPQHAGEGVTGFDCRICHANGGSTNSLNHGNSKINFTFTGLGENTHYSYSSAKTPGSAAYGTCYNGNCHGRATITWGPLNPATSLCEKCHTTNTSASGFYSTSGSASTTANTDPYVGAHFQHITSVPYKYSAKIDCSACHLKPTGPYTPGHIDSALPAEISFGTVAGSGVQNGYTSADHQPFYNYGARECGNVWCHGGGMASNAGLGPYGSAEYDGGSLGSPAAAVWNEPYLTGVGTNDCVKCHAFPPPAPMPGYTHYDETNGRPYIANQCILCHKHVDETGYAFKNPDLHVNGIVDSCNTCHGRPPIDEKGLTVPAVGALTSGTVGAHQAHAINPNIGNNCNVCHDQYSMDMPSYFMEMGFNAYGGRVTGGTFYGYSTLSANYSPLIVYKSSNAGTVVRRTTDPENLNNCSNLYCHGGGTATLPPLAGGSNTKPNWEGGSSQAACGSCHGISGETYRSSGSHGAHVGTGFGEPRLGCSNCHGIKENNYHVDGAVEWNFYSTARRLNQTAGYGDTGYKPFGGSSFASSGLVQNLAPSAGWGSCQVYCHSDGKGTYANPLPVWGGAPMHCGSCHLNQTSLFSGSHEKHSKSSALGGYGIDCLICHNGSGSGSELHVNGSFDVVFNTGVVGASATWANGTKQCFSILCHDSTSSTGPTWNEPATGNYDTGTYKPTCIGCHSGEVGGRAAVIPQFAGESHHFQGAEINSTVCYPCHMEANANGTANTTYHDRTAGKTVDLMVWGTGARGAVFTRYTANGNTTRKRTEYTKISTHCVSCHNEANKAITPFGDGKTPIQYAWDGNSIDARYSQAGTTTWGKVNSTTYPNANERDKRTKAYSAHGNVGANQRGWNSTTGFDGPFPADVVNTGKNVVCFDCHNSHGTTASGVMTSYSSATGRGKGGILKETNSGVGGYTVTYQPVAGGSAETKNAYNPGAAICIDCHTTANTGNKPWTYDGTFGLTQEIYGYWDTPGFGDGTFGSAQRSAYRTSSGPNKGGHFGASSALTTTTQKPAIPNASVTMTAGINGLCTPCHDPHGVSPVTPANQPYMVPLLKGTWVTSPYDEDIAAVGNNQARGGTNKNSDDGVTGGSTQRPIRQLVGSTPKYKLDQNTFGSTTNTSQPNFGTTQTAPSWNYATATKIGNTETEFAGLCMNCHEKSSLAPKAGQAVAPDAWKSVSRIHGTVKGWATTVQASDGNYSNTIHAFTCSKCHTPHNAKLPRLMVTNCLDYNHRGQVASGGTVSASAGNSSGGGGGTNIAASAHQIVTGEKGSGQGRFPAGGKMKTNNGKQQNPGKWFFGLTGTNGFINCHNTGISGGTSYPNSMLWNTKTPW